MTRQSRVLSLWRIVAEVNDGLCDSRSSCFCGICGLKPSFGRVPAYPPSPLGLLSHHGPIARNRRRCSGDAAGRPSRAPTTATPMRCRPDDRDWQAGIDGGVERLADRASARIWATRGAGKHSESRRGGRGQRPGNSRVRARSSSRWSRIFASPRDALFTLWAAGVAALLRSLPGRAEGVGRSGAVGNGRGRRAARRRRVGCAPIWCATPSAGTMGGFHATLRPAADPDDADPGLAGRAGSERPGARAALDRLVAVELPVQHDPSAGGEHPRAA